jgi:FAD/FMN-containing dehydrogenase
MKTQLSSALLASLLALSACAPAVEEGPDVEGCEHLQEGPATAVTASASATSAPAVSNDHKRYDVALGDVAGGRGGSVSFAVSEAGDYVLFLGRDVPVRVSAPGGATVEAEERLTSSPVCTEVKVRATYALGVGTHTLTFGPTSEASVSLVLEEAAHAHGEE